MTVQQALEQSGLSEDLLLSGLEQFLQSDQGEVQGFQRPPEIAGFRIREDGGVVFYLDAYMDDGDGSLDPWHGSISGRTAPSPAMIMPPSRSPL